MVATGYTMVWCGDLLVFMMAPLAHGLRLGSELQSGPQRRLTWAVGLAMIIALVLSAWFTIYLAYRYGSMNLLISQHYSEEPSRFALEKITNPHRPQPERILVDGRRRTDYGTAACGPAPVSVVAFPSPRLLGQPRPGNGRDLVHSFSSLALLRAWCSNTGG